MILFKVALSFKRSNKPRTFQIINPNIVLQRFAEKCEKLNACIFSCAGTKSKSGLSFWTDADFYSSKNPKVAKKHQI